MLLEDETRRRQPGRPAAGLRALPRGRAHGAAGARRGGASSAARGRSTWSSPSCAALERPDLPLAEVRQIEPPVDRETGREPAPEVLELDRVREARERAVAELRAVAPAAHSFGRRGR